MNDVLILFAEDGTRRTVFCSLKSVGQSEFYQAATTNYKPELKFVLADYLEYNGESIVKHNDVHYRVIRSFRAGQELELVVEKASAEEVEFYG